ncbi:UvrD-helicase domain-containing protein [Rudaeicoccus suwonensis]|uniref:DNA 3'-5' helicase n=1 Tax=Rudaeicoccus suwonensis TaxID=657409 RepID=A0A561EC82_9MICO|nr:UvrD-helicase domain-containing protein [Rudaeicoccus suwonensis]TWE13220.1 ATP-dependent exoDNAse (exonuclease V) beta subunit [Rudaeicoccus suwonensis]
MSGEFDSEVHELTDADARRRICECTDETLFVDAGAGSGKTSALVGRIRTLVLRDGIDIQHIAAVTFTERAGAELRERLRESFEKARADHDHELVDAALDGLDLAAIGTLHAFAQRILVQHSIEAGIPPLLEVRDAVGSSVAAEARWRTMWRRLLDDDAMGETLLAAIELGVTESQLQQLATQLGNDWDLIDSHVLSHPALRLSTPDSTAIRRAAQDVLDQRRHCTADDDTLLAPMLQIEQWLQSRPTTADLITEIRWLSAVPALKVGKSGRQENWKSGDLKALRVDIPGLHAAAQDALAPLKAAVLRTLARWFSQEVLAAAEERRANGTLEFHDLLVLTRNLLRDNAEVRASLQHRYQRLLLDEFQDTDPIQIEIATRIAGGATATQDDWRQVEVPPGSLFVVGDPKQSIYRFRRADIRTYLGAREVIGESVALTTNFRTTTPIVDWVNVVFGKHIQQQHDAQPAYEALDPVRSAATAGPSVGILGEHPHEQDSKPMRIAQVRQIEADEVAGVIQTALRDGWTTQGTCGEWRPVRKRDITILIPARTSLPFLETALDRAGIDYRSDASSLVYAAPEVRAVFAAARVIADPSDELSLVTALRSPLFGCGDDDLWTWKRDGGSFNLRARVPDDLVDHPVGSSVNYLRRLHFRAPWLAPSELLDTIVTDRRVMELAGDGPRARDTWRRLRYVIDQARAWAEVEHGGLRAYLAWAAGQAKSSAQASESLLPELDVDAVRIMTVHAAKGLEFPVVILSGLSSQPRNSTGVQLLWRHDDYELRVQKDLATADFDDYAPIDEQMGDLERARLMYVAATRARDHLVVSLHRSSRNARSNADLLVASGAIGAGADVLSPEPTDAGASSTQQRAVTPPPDFDDWQRQWQQATDRTRTSWSRSASGLEGTDPQALLGAGAPAVAADPQTSDDAEVTDAEAPAVGSDAAGARAAEEVSPPGAAKGARALDSPAWAKGRDGAAIGRAVHGSLQAVELRGDGADLPAVVAAQCIAEGVTPYEQLVATLARNALSHNVVQCAADRRHWREMFVGIPDDGQILEGVIDLLYQDDDGSLVIVDYKTDQIPEAALDTRTAYYRPQLLAYRQMVQTATGLPVSACILLFVHEQGVWQRAVV